MTELELLTPQNMEDKRTAKGSIPEAKTTRTDGACVEIVEYKAVAPDGGWGWMVVLGSFVINFMLEGMTRSMGIIYVALLEKYQDTAAATALATSLHNTIFLVLGPVASIFAERWGCRLVVIAGAILSCVACVLSAEATRLLHLNLAYGILGGIGDGLMFAPMYIIVGQYFDKRRGKAMSIGTVGCGVGAIAMAPLITFLMEEYAMYGTFIIMGGMMLHCAVAGMLFRPLAGPETRITYRTTSISSGPGELSTDRPSGGGEYQVETSKPAAAAAEEKTSRDTGHARLMSFLSRFSMLKDVTFLLYCVNMMSVCFCVQGPLTFLPVLALEKGLSPNQSAMLLAVAGCADIAGRFLNGIVFDLKSIRHRRRPLHSVIGIASGCTVVALGLAPSFYSLGAVIVVWGLAEGGFHGQRTTIISEIVSQDHQSSAIGISIFFQGVGNMLAPVTAAMIGDNFNSYSISMYFFGGVVITASTLFLLDYVCRRLKRKPPPASNRTV